MGLILSWQLIPNSCRVACGDSYAVLLPSTCLRPPPSTETRCFIVLTALLHCVTVCLPLQVTVGHCMWSVSEKGRGWCVQGGRRSSGWGLCVGRVVCVLWCTVTALSPSPPSLPPLCRSLALATQGAMWQMTGQESATHTPVSSSPRQCWRQPTTSEVHYARDSTTYLLHCSHGVVCARLQGPCGLV